MLGSRLSCFTECHSWTNIFVVHQAVEALVDASTRPERGKRRGRSGKAGEASIDRALLTLLAAHFTACAPRSAILSSWAAFGIDICCLVALFVYKQHRPHTDRPHRMELSCQRALEGAGGTPRVLHVTRALTSLRHVGATVLLRYIETTYVTVHALVHTCKSRSRL